MKQDIVMEQGSGNGEDQRNTPNIFVDACYGLLASITIGITCSGLFVGIIMALNFHS